VTPASVVVAWDAKATIASRMGTAVSLGGNGPDRRAGDRSRSLPQRRHHSTSADNSVKNVLKSSGTTAASISRATSTAPAFT